MIEQEAKEIAARLTRVWTPKTSKWKHPLPWEDTTPTPQWTYYAEIGIDPYFEDFEEFYIMVFFGRQGTLPNRVTFYNHQLRFVCVDGRRCSFSIEGVWNDLFSWQEPKQTFINQWVSAFRRGCWLSGCDIEASAHEKMEWIQGFSREELESWNLKF